MKLIVGLGNPGKKYEKTRHNVGKIALKKLSQKADISKKDLLLAETASYMNISGPEILDLMTCQGIKSSSDILILVDDIHLPFGKIRFRSKGSSGGHNGLASIIESLGTEEFARIRIGVGKPEDEDWKDYVLAPFTRVEVGQMGAILERVCDCALAWLSESPLKVMQKFNG